MGKRNLGSLLLALAGIIIIFAAYCNTLTSPPVLDDFHSFINDRQVYLSQISFSSLMSLAKTKFGWPRLIPMITFALDHKIGGGDARVFHFTNIFIHMLAFLSVCFLMRQLLELERNRKSLTSTIFTNHYVFLIAAIWALNPVNTNAVTYVVQRMASIQTIFYLLAVGFYIKGRRTHLESQIWSKGLVFYAACGASSILAFFSKENSAMLPVMLLMTEVWFFRVDLHRAVWDRLKRCRWVSIAAMAIFALLAVGFFIRFLQAHLYYGLRPFTLSQRLLTEARVVVWYMSLLIWPDPSRLCLDHDVAISTSLFHPWTTVPSIAVIALLAFSTFRFRKRFPLITYGMLWFLANLVIESTIIPLELVFEHRLYLPSIGFDITFVAGVILAIRFVFKKAGSHDFSVLTECSLAIALSLLTLTTFIRNEAWQNNLTIAADSVSKSPNKPRTHANLSVALLRAKQYDEAIEEAEKAISLGGKLQTDYAVAAQVIIGAYDQKQEFDEAIRRGEQFIADFPAKTADAQALPNLCLNLSEAYLQTGDFDKAFHSATLGLVYLLSFQPQLDFYYDKQSVKSAMERILTLARQASVEVKVDGCSEPEELSIPVLVAKEFLAKGDRAFAMGILEEDQAQNPEDPQGRHMLEAMKQEDSLNSAQRSKWDYVARYVDHPYTKYNFCMAMAYTIQRKRLSGLFVKLGEKFLDHALAMRPDAADAHLLKGWYYYDRDDSNHAVSEAREALKLDPDYAQAWLGLGFFLAKTDKPEEAINAFHKTFELYPGYPNRPAIMGIIAGIQEQLAPKEKDEADHARDPERVLSQKDSSLPPS